MSEIIRLTTPLTDKVIEKLKVGDQVLITGTLYTARDAAHKRLVDLLNNGKELPFDIRGQIIYYVGPAPAKPGYVTGPAGPTTSGRMDPYAPRLMAAGLKGMIGKGKRSKDVGDAMKKNKCARSSAPPSPSKENSGQGHPHHDRLLEDLGTEAVR